jgi:glutamyl-tRNA reductase
VLGDSAIQNQVKTAYQQACKQRKLDKFMHKLFQTALRTGKLVRSQTNISRGSVSYANAMYHIVAHKEQVPLDTPIVIVGVNDITRNVLRFLIKKGYRRIILLNRTLSRAEKMAKEFGIAYGPLSELQVALLGAGVLIAAAAAPEHVIGYEMFSPRPYVVVDVGVPPNVDQKILQCMNIVYYGIDSIENQINNAFSFRQKESEAANYIIETMVREFMQWQEAEIRRSVDGQVYLAANI